MINRVLSLIGEAVQKKRKFKKIQSITEQMFLSGQKKFNIWLIVDFKNNIAEV